MMYVLHICVRFTHIKHSQAPKYYLLQYHWFYWTPEDYCHVHEEFFPKEPVCYTLSESGKHGAHKARFSKSSSKALGVL